MEIQATPYKRCTLVKVTGRIDSDTSPTLKDTLQKITGEGIYKIVFDMSEIEFISSAGIWVLMETQKACKRWNRGEMVLTTPNENMERTLELSGAKHFFKVFDDITAGVGSF